MMIESRSCSRVLKALLLCLFLPTLVVRADSILDRMPNTTIALFVVKVDDGQMDRITKLNGDKPSTFPSTSPIGWISDEDFKNVKAFGACMKQITPAGMTIIIEFSSSESAEKALDEHEPEETEIDGVESFTFEGTEYVVKQMGSTLFLNRAIAGPESLKLVDVVKKSVTTVMNAEAMKAYEKGDFYFWMNMPKVRPLLSIGISTLIGMMEQQTNAQRGIAGDSFVLGRRMGTETIKGFRNLLMETSEFHGYARVGENEIQAHVRVGLEKGKYFEGAIKGSSQTTTELLKGLPAEDAAVIVGVDMNTWAGLLNDMVNVGFKRVLTTKGENGEAELIKNIETALAKASFLKDASELSMAIVPSKEEDNAMVGRFHSVDDPKAFGEVVDLMNFGRELAKGLGEGQGIEEIKITDTDQGKRAAMTTEDQTLHVSLTQTASGLFWGVGQKIETLEAFANAGDKEVDPSSAVGQILAKLTPKASVVVLLNARHLQTFVLTTESESKEPSETNPKTSALAGMTLAVRDSGFDLDGYFPAEFLQNLPDPPSRTTTPVVEEEPGDDKGEESEEGPPEF